MTVFIVLLSQVEQLIGENEGWEYREQGLIEDCVRQLDDANKHVSTKQPNVWDTCVTKDQCKLM